MFWKILKKDLKRKKTMNILLLLFITLTATLLGASIHMLSTNGKIVKNYIEQAKIADFTALTYNSDEDQKKTQDWLSGSDHVKQYSVDTFILLMKGDITLPENREKIDFDNAMALQTASTENNLMFDENDAPIKIEPGDIGLPYYFADMTGLTIGDKVTITLEGKQKEFTISHYIKDAFCGSAMMGFKRWIVNEQDYKYFDTQEVTKFNIVNACSTEDSDAQTLAKEFNRIGIPSLSTIEKDIVETSYIMSMVIASVLMVISVLLILIAFLILRFTIAFTLQEDYKEIGIMKAIGLKGYSIQSIYMVKYLAMGLAGGVVGYLISIPLGTTLMDTVCSEMLRTKTSWWNLPSLIGIVVLIGIILFYCRICTRRLNKFSAITAIRGGATGERFHRLSGFHLKKWKMGSMTFMAINDILHSGRRYAALFISFVLGTIVLIVPLNIIQTMKSPALLKMFGYTDFDFTVIPNNNNKIMLTYTTDELLSYIDNLEQHYKDNGVNVDLYPELSYMTLIYKDDIEDSKTIYTSKSYGMPASEYTMEEGTSPKLANELAMTQQVAQYYDVGIGDTIHVKIGDEDKEYIISGIYNGMINLGENIRLSEDSRYSMDTCSGLSIHGRFVDSVNKTEAIDQLKTLTEDGQIKTSLAYLHELMGNVVDTLDVVNTAILVIVLIINFIITTLVVKMLVTKEAADVAVLKSQGFHNNSLQGWQIKRMAILLILAVVVGTILAQLLDGPVCLRIIGIMGASKIDMVIDPLRVYLIYPGIILGFTMIATFISTIGIRKIKVWEINNQE